MNNLLWCVIPTLIVSLVPLIATIIICIKKFKKCWWIALICFIGFLVLVIACIPYVKDVKGKELITFEGTYIDSNTISGNNLLTNKLHFKNGNKEKDVVLSVFLYENYNLKLNNKYKITYYKNSSAIHSIELLNE